MRAPARRGVRRGGRSRGGRLPSAQDNTLPRRWHSTRSTPVLVGVGAVVQREDDAAAAKEPVELMIDALGRAGEDAGAPALLAEAGTVIVPKGIWSYPDPARIVADRFGAPRPHGAGRGRDPAAVAVHARGRPHRRRRGRRGARRRRRGEVPRAAGPDRGYDRARDTAGRDHAPTSGSTPTATSSAGSRSRRGLAVPARQYAVIETALRRRDRHERRRAPAGARRAPVGVQPRRRGQPGRLGPHRPRPPPTSHPSPANRIVALPYTKLHCSQWNVDLAAGHVLCSVETATRHGIPRDRWVFPVGRRRVEHDDPDDGAGRAAPVARVRARRRAGCSRRPAPPSTTSPTSTCTAASPRRCASRRASWAWPTGGRSP